MSTGNEPPELAEEKKPWAGGRSEMDRATGVGQLSDTGGFGISAIFAQDSHE
jgi:hypothetical protein